GAHDERIVDRDAGDLVDALAFEVLSLLDVGGQVLRRAGRREGAGHGEQGDALAAEEVAASGRLRPVGGGDGQRYVGEAIALLDGHCFYSFASVETADRP